VNLDSRRPAVVKGDDLHGMIVFHLGNDSGFVGQKAKSQKGSSGKGVGTDEWTQ